MARNPRKINPDLPSTAISFDKRMLVQLKRIAQAEDRSLASLVRLAVSEWLQSPSGQQMVEKSHRERVVGASEKPRQLRMLVKETLPDDTSLLRDMDDGTPEVGLAEIKAKLADLEAKVEAQARANAGGKE